MASLFARMLAGEEPARFVWKDELCAAVVADHPVQHGHVIVFPREEIDHWQDVPPATAARLFLVMQRIGAAQREAFTCEKVAVAIIGLVTRHAHAHLVPIRTIADLDFGKPETNPHPAQLDAVAVALRKRL